MAAIRANRTNAAVLEVARQFHIWKIKRLFELSGSILTFNRFVTFLLFYIIKVITENFQEIEEFNNNTQYACIELY